MAAHNFSIFLVLVRRNLKVMRSHFFSMVVNGCIVGALQAVLYGYFMPQMGMPTAMIAPMYLGTIMMMFMNIGSDRLFRESYDLESLRFVDYQISLPISKVWLVASFILSYVIELTIQAFFPTVVGALMISSVLDLSQFNIAWVLIIHALSVFFCSLFYLTLTYAFPFTWNVDHAWPRIFIPMMFVGAVYYPWNVINNHSSIWGTIFLGNPFTYIVEGYRAAFFGQANYISLLHCSGALFLFSCVMALLLSYALCKRLDPL